MKDSLVNTTLGVIGIQLGCLYACAVIGLVYSLPLMLAWNWALVELMKLPEITWFQSYCVAVLLTLIKLPLTIK